MKKKSNIISVVEGQNCIHNEIRKIKDRSLRFCKISNSRCGKNSVCFTFTPEGKFYFEVKEEKI